ncbi:hypothetical protein WJX79_004738 [Trebouxia sp. C0005]
MEADQHAGQPELPAQLADSGPFQRPSKVKPVSPAATTREAIRALQPPSPLSLTPALASVPDQSDTKTGATVLVEPQARQQPQQLCDRTLVPKLQPRAVTLARQTSLAGSAEPSLQTPAPVSNQLNAQPDMPSPAVTSAREAPEQLQGSVKVEADTELLHNSSSQSAVELSPLDLGTSPSDQNITQVPDHKGHRSAVSAGSRGAAPKVANFSRQDTTQPSALSWSVDRNVQASFLSKSMTVCYSWGSGSAARGEVDLTAWLCSTSVMGRRWSNSGLARHSHELLPVSVSMTQRNAVSSLSTAEWSERLRDKWNGDLLVFAPPRAESAEKGNSKAHLQLGLARLGGILRSSGQALSTVIATATSDSKSETVHEAHLWLTAGRGMIDSVFDMLPRDVQYKLEVAVPAMFQKDDVCNLGFLFGVITLEPTERVECEYNADSSVFQKPKTPHANRKKRRRLSRETHLSSSRNSFTAACPYKAAMCRRWVASQSCSLIQHVKTKQSAILCRVGRTSAVQAMAGSFSHNDRVHYPWLHPEPQDCVTSNTSPYSWGVDSAAQGQIDLIAWICATDTVGREWSESGLAAHSSQILPSALTLSERACVGALGSAAWQEELQTAWNGDLLVFAMPQAGNDSSNAHRSHAELQFVRLAGLLRASGEALAGTIALHAADGEDDRLLEARLWLTASRGTIDTVFDMLSEEAQHSLEAAVPAMFQPYKHAELTCLFGIITMAHLAGNNDAKVSAKPKCYEQSQQRGSNQCQVARPSRDVKHGEYPVCPLLNLPPYKSKICRSQLVNSRYSQTVFDQYIYRMGAFRITAC